MRFQLHVLLASLAVLLVAPAALAEGPGYQPGEWEVTTVTTMKGLPMEVPAQKQTLRQCLDGKAAVPDTARKDEKCTVLEQKVEGGKVTWKIRCKDAQSTSEGQGEVTYSATSYAGTMTFVINAGGQTIKADMKMNGRRVGDCKK
jgi:hypothetical protein